MHCQMLLPEFQCQDESLLGDAINARPSRQEEPLELTYQLESQSQRTERNSFYRT